MKKLFLYLLLFSSFNLVAQLPSYVPSAGLVGWWPFNGNANDESGNGNHGIAFNVIQTIDRFGNQDSAYNFSLGNSYIQLDTTNFLEYTISCWINDFIVNDTSVFFSTQFYMPENYYYHSIWTGHIMSHYRIPYTFPYGNAFEFYTPYNAFDSTWHNITISYDGMIMHHYIDGALVNSDSPGVQGLIDSTGNKYIGQPGSTFNGDIDDVGIWSRVLDSCEILDLYHSTLDYCNTASIDANKISSATIFPNPSNNWVTIYLSQHSNGQIILNDILGKEVLSKSFTSNEVQLNLKCLESKGTYFAKVLDIDGNVIAIKKLIYQ